MRFTQRGYIVNNLTSTVVGTWVIFGGKFLGFSGDDAELKSTLADIKREGVTSIEVIGSVSGEAIYDVTSIGASEASLTDIGSALVFNGFSLLSADEVEDIGENTIFETDAPKESSDLGVWSDERGYILNKEGRPVTVWFMVGDVVEIQAAGDKALDTIVQDLKQKGISTIEGHFIRDGLRGHNKIILPYTEASPIDLAIELSNHGYSMLPATEVEAAETQENWIPWV